jgi:hypothetical protein
MVTSVSMRNATWMDGIQVNAQDLRLQAVAGRLTGASPSGSTGIAARPGVRYGTGDPLKVSASSGMNVTVNAGFVYVQGTVSATAGMYEGCLDTTSTLTVTTSDPTNPRIDNVIAKFVDNGDNTSIGTVAIQPGTPAPSPVAPTLPANSLLLATIAVGAGVSSITAGNITEGRVYTVATGGIVPMKDVTGGITGQAGLYAHDLSTGRLKVSDGAGNARQPKIAAFAPVSASSSTSPIVVTNPAFSVVVSLAVTVDGVTEIEFLASWFGFGQSPSPTAGSRITNQIWMDGVFITGAGQALEWNYVKTWSGDASGGECGGSFRGIYTPAAGTHTFAWYAGATAANMYIVYPWFRIAPSVQQ